MKSSKVIYFSVFASLAITSPALLGGEAKVVIDDAAPVASAEAMTLFPIPDYTGDLANRSVLTGDWGGARTALAEDNGIQIETHLRNYYQGVVDGGSNQDWEYSGIAEYVFKFDTNEAGLWPGGFLFARGETFFGRGINGRTGALLPANTHFALKLPADVGTYLSHFYFTQMVSEKAGVLIGKLDTLTGDMNAFAHLMGHDQFMNLGFNVNPVLLDGAPYSPLGAGFFVMPAKNLTLKFVALDTDGRIDRSGFDTVFKGGSTYLGEVTLATRFFDQPGRQNLIALYINEDKNSAVQDPRVFLPGSGVTPVQTSESWAIAYNFDQFIISDPNNPAKGVGVFGRVGVTDGRANIMKHFLSAGIGGTGLIPSRENDRFGVGYYYLNLADGRSNIILGDDEQGVEVFYNIVPAPWCDLTLNLQVVDQAVKGVETATILGLRGSIVF